MGNPGQFVIIGCVPNRIDPPHPALSRANGTHGFATAGNVVEVNNDADSSQVRSWPNGVLKSVSSQGDVTAQTQGEARTQLMHDGNVRMENPQGSTSITPEGTITQQNAAGAIAALKKDGDVSIQNPSGSALHLKKISSQMKGPLGGILGQLKEAGKTLTTALSASKKIMEQAKLLSGSLPGLDPSRLGDVISKADELFSELNNTLQTQMPKAVELLDKLQTASVEDLGNSLMTQAQRAAENYTPQIFKAVEEMLQNGSTLEQMLTKLEQQLPQNALEHVTSEVLSELQTTLRGLQHVPDGQKLQMRSILDAFLADSSDSVTGLLETGLAGALEEIREQVDPWIGVLLPEDPQELERIIVMVRNAIPERVETLAGEARMRQIILEMLGSNTVDDALRRLSGYATQGILGRTKEQVAAHTQATAAVSPMMRAFGAAKVQNKSQMAKSLQELASVDGMPSDFGVDQIQGEDGQMDGGIEKWMQEQGGTLMKEALDSLQQQMGGLLSGGLDESMSLDSLVSQMDGGSVVEALPMLVKASTSIGGAGGQLLVSPPLAALVGPMGSSQVFASAATAGFTSPFGSFAFGAFGGSMFSLGSMVMKMAQKGAKGSVGLSFTKQQGASLNSYSDNRRPDDDDDPDREPRNVTAQVAVNAGTAFLRALNGSQVANQIAVTHNGIFINGRDISFLWGYDDRFSSIEGRLSTLEAAAVPPPPATT
jgi:hypothetical protein